MSIYPSTLRAMKMRFNASYTNTCLMLHWLPNGLYVLTFDPDFAKSINTIDFSEEIDIKKEITPKEPFAMLNEKPLYFPFQGTIIDFNQNLPQSIPLFSEGPTSSFLLIVRPKAKFTLPEDYQIIFKKD